VRPILLEIPSLGIVVPSYPAMLVIAVVACLWIGPRWAERLEELDRRRVLWALCCAGVATFLGGHLHFLFGTWFGSGAGDRWVWSLHAAGAIAALAVAAPFVLRAFGLPIGKFGDGLAPTVGIGIFLARIGCFLRGCCFGTRCEGRFCIRFPPETLVYGLHMTYGDIQPGATHSAAVHPLQLYFAASGLLVTLVALLAHPRKQYDGQVALLAFLTFSASAAALEFLRADYYPRAYWGSLPQLEWVALGMAAVAALALVLGDRLRERPRT